MNLCIDLPSLSTMLTVAVVSVPSSPATGLLKIAVKLSALSWIESSTV